MQASAASSFNARAETLAEKPAFRKALEKRRCVIPADGFYEWRKNADGSKTPMYITLASEGVFAFAGLFETWKDPLGEEVKTCTIITTGPNGLLAGVHDRMPAILSPEGVKAWLAGTGEEKVLELLKAYPAEQMKMRPVGRGVNSAAREGAELIAPVADVPVAEKKQRGKGEMPGQGALF